MPPESREQAPLWSAQQLADYLGVSVPTLHAMRRRGEGPAAYRVGRFLRYDPVEVGEWLRDTAAEQGSGEERDG